jgi:uroporphyrinogen-III synthase
MFVLLTRPLDEAERTAEKLREMGHTPVLSPVIEIVPTGAIWPHGVIDAVIATSARAFQCADPAPDWPLPEARRLYPLFVVGAKTAEAAHARGFEGPQRVTLDAKALCSVLREKLEPLARVLFLAGRDRKSEIEACSAEMDLMLEVVETYAAEPAPRLSPRAVQLAAEGAIGAMLHFSRRSAEIFLKLAAEADFDPTPLIHVAISEDVAEPLSALPKVVVAEEPNEEAILALFRPPPPDKKT